MTTWWDDFNDWGGRHFNAILWVVGGLLLAALVAFMVWYMRPISGNVEDKQFIPAHWQTYYTESCITTTSGKKTTRTCIQTPQQRWVLDKWNIKVCNTERCKWVSVTQTFYDDLQIGSYYSER